MARFDRFLRGARSIAVDTTVLLAAMAAGCGQTTAEPASDIDGGPLLDADCGIPAEAADVRVDAAEAEAAVDADGSDRDAWIAPSDADSADACPPAAGSLIVYAIPPPESLDWSTPNALLNSVAASALAGEALTLSGRAVLSHEIGHVNLELDCGSTSIPLTGQTGGGEEWVSGADGFGIVFRDYPGSMNEMTDSIGDNVDTVADIQARQASGNLTRITFSVNEQMCQRLKDFHDQYIASGAYTHYDALDRPRRFEGAGCAIYGAGVIDVGGLLRRSLFTPVWARTLFVGSARFANTAGVNPYYTYGSNLVAQDSDGTDWIWPAGVNVPASTVSPIIPDSPVMNSWTGPEDTPFEIPGVTLPARIASAVPFTLYDPQLMAVWAEQVWSEATADGSAVSLAATWTADTIQAVHEITYDAHCVMPQTIAFDQDNDDLFKDSDSP